MSISLALAVLMLHPGGLAADGCHRDRQRGGRHCHRTGATPSTDGRLSGGAYLNCTAAPVRRGEPGYGPHLDRNGDGIGCERR